MVKSFTTDGYTSPSDGSKHSTDEVFHHTWGWQDSALGRAGCEMTPISFWFRFLTHSGSDSLSNSESYSVSDSYFIDSDPNSDSTPDPILTLLLIMTFLWWF